VSTTSEAHVRQLEVVAVSDDGTQVLLASAEDAVRATHSLRIDNRLQAALRGDLGQDAGRRESELSPKEIQARLRAGEAPEDVAKAAKVAVSRVLRYAGPVISERERIIDQARAAVVQRSRGPELAMPLGEMIEKRLAVTVGLRPETVAWTARRRDDGAWIVLLSYSARGGARTASWVWVPADRDLTASNVLASRLAADDLAPSGRKRAAVRSAPKPKSRPAAKKVAAKKSASAGKKAAPAAKKTVPAAKKAAPAKQAAPVKRAPAAKKAPPAAKPKAAAAKRTTIKPIVLAPPAKRGSPATKTATKTATPAAAGAKRGTGRKAVPSWDDVLLGVQSPTAARGRRKS
jgi:hypothetical protein